jgi:hypothetical protein
MARQVEGRKGVSAVDLVIRMRNLRGMTEHSDPVPGDKNMAIWSASRDRTASESRARSERVAG